jgi:radical SAM-linked protein
MKLRIRFGKLGKVRWTSHRDVARMWERAFRRTGVALAYTAGFSPRPKISFGLALPTGHESVAEYLDVELAEEGPQDFEGVVESLSDALPVGVDATGGVILDPGAGSLQEEVTSCTWTIQVPGVSLSGVEELVANALAAESLVVTRTRKGREVTDDLRQALLVATAVEAADGPTVRCELLTQPRGVRPTELLAALDPALELGGVCRMHQWIERGGARYEPLDAPLLAPQALARIAEAG